MNETITTIVAQIATEIAHHGDDTITRWAVYAHNADEGWEVAGTRITLTDAQMATVYEQARVLSRTLPEVG